MDKQSLTYKTFKNISYGVVGYVWGFVFSIFITPIIVLKLGVETYGLYILVLTVSNLMGLLNFGIAEILIKYIAQYNATSQEDEMKKLIYSFNSILLGLSTLCLIILSCVGYFADIIFQSQNVSREYFFVIFFLQGLIFFVNGVGAVYSLTSVALQRFEIGTRLGLLNITFSNLTILLLVVLGYNLKAIFLALLAYSIIFVMLNRYYAKMILPAVALRFSWHWNVIKYSYKFGVATSLGNIANSALTYFDRLLIPIFLGPAALAYYSLPGNVAAKTPSVTNTLSGVIFPMISSLNGLQDTEKISNIYRRAVNLLTVISFAITISIILFANKILLHWLSADFAEKSTDVLIILAITYYILSLGGTLNAFLLGMSRTKFLAQMSIFMAMANIILLFILLPEFGIKGAAWAYFISVLPVIYMFYFVEKNYLKLTGRMSSYLLIYSKIAIVAVVFVFLIKFAILPLVNSINSLIIFGPVSVLLYLLIYRVFGFFDQEDVSAISSFIATIFKKIINYQQKET